MKALSPSARSLPSSVEAEAYLISSCLIDGRDVVARCIVGKISPDSFYDPKHGLIYGVMLEMFHNQKPIELSSVAEELKIKRLLESIDGYPFLLKVSSLVPTTAQASYFIDRVKEHALLRSIIRSAKSIEEDCYGYTGDMPEFISGVESKFIRTITDYSGDTARPLKDICAQINSEVADLVSGKITGAERDLSWGFDDADRYLKPFRRGELVCLAARPGIGKSSLLRQICFKNVVRDSRNVAVFTLEVTTEEFIRNVAQAASGVNPREAKNYHKDEVDAFVRWIDRIGTFDKTLHVFDVNTSLSGIIAQIRLLHARTPVDLVFIDYLQLINERADKGENRDQLLGRITRALKLLANELQCVVIVLSQLNRAMEREDRAPQLSDLRESGNIEADCDRVAMIHRPKYDPRANPPSEQRIDDELVRFFYCDILQRKGRNVGEHSLGMMFERQAARFIPISRER